MIINTVASIAQEIHEELGDPSDLSIAAIAAWIRRNIGGLANLLNTDYSIDETTLEINPNLTDVEKYVFKKMYGVYFLDLKIKPSDEQFYKILGGKVYSRKVKNLLESFQINEVN